MVPFSQESLGVKLIARPEQNEYSVNVRYRIVGTEDFNVQTDPNPYKIGYK